MRVFACRCITDAHTHTHALAESVQIAALATPTDEWIDRSMTHLGLIDSGGNNSTHTRVHMHLCAYKLTWYGIHNLSVYELAQKIYMHMHTDSAHLHKRLYLHNVVDIGLGTVL